MSTDNRTTLNDCSSVSGWTGDDAVSTDTSNGQSYEGGTSLSTQLSNSDEHMYTTTIGGTRDLSDSTCYMLIKDNLNESQANGGVKYVLHDGTDRIGYEIGGNDNTGLSLPTFFFSYKLDVSNSAAFTAHAFSGSEGNLGKNAITGVGYGSLHLSKANGAIDNAWMDRFSFIVNGNAALTVNGGTVGTPETFADVASDDITNGWGLIANPQGSQFNIFGTTEFGDSGASDSFFSESDSQITLNGIGIGVGNFNFQTIANATGTNLFELNNCVVVNLGAIANWDFSDANIDTLGIDSTQWVDCGTFVFPVSGGTDRHCNDSTFVNCGQVNPSTMTFLRNTFIGSRDANGAILRNGDLADTTFTSDGTGHAVEITSTGTYDYDGNSFTGYGADTTTDAVVFNDSGGLVTINVNSGDTPTFRNGAGSSTVIIAGAVTTKVVCSDSLSNALLEGVAVLVKAGNTIGGLAFEDIVTITRSGTTATVTHTAHGLATNNWIEIENAIQNEYNRLKQITVIDANSYTFSVSGNPTTPATGTILSTAVIVNGATDVNGEISDTRVFSVDQNVTGSAAKGTSSPLYVKSPISTLINKDNGVNINILMNLDE